MLCASGERAFGEAGQAIQKEGSDRQRQAEAETFRQQQKNLFNKSELDQRHVWWRSTHACSKVAEPESNVIIQEQSQNLQHWCLPPLPSHTTIHELCHQHLPCHHTLRYMNSVTNTSLAIKHYDT
jgi:hypothetical protein